MSRDSFVATAHSLRDEITSVRSQTEADRRLPEAIVDALVDAQLFRLSLPMDLDAPEVDPLTALDVYEELARAEGSTAWLVWNSSLPCLFSRFLAPAVRKELFGDPRWKYASSTRPTGRAARAYGGYRITGRWSLVSGCMHADWVGLMCLVEADGEIEMVEPGAPHMRMVFVPADSCEIVDTWHVGGLRGTGSHDVVLNGVDVPAERTLSPMEPSRMDRPIGRMPIACTMSAGHASICLGMARTAFDAVVELGRSKVTVDPVPHLPDRAANQFAVAEASTAIPAFRARLRDAVATVWASARAAEPCTVEAIADVWSAAVTAARGSRRIVDTLYEVAGSPALYVDSVLERTHRDIHAALQHVIVQRVWMEDVGRVHFGMEPTSPLFAL